MIAFRKAFLAKYLNIKKPERTSPPQQALRKKEDYFSLAERNFIKTTDLNQKQYGDTSFVTSGLEKILSRRIAMPQYLTSYPPTKKYFDEYQTSPGSPADRARLIQSVSQVLGSDGYSNNEFRNLMSKIPYVADIINGYFDPRDPGMRNLHFTSYVNEQQAQHNKSMFESSRPDSMQVDPTSGISNIDVNQYMPEYTQSYVKNQFDSSMQNNLIKYIMHQKMANLHYTLRLMYQISSTLTVDIKIVTQSLVMAQRMTHVTNSNAHEAHNLLTEVIRKLSMAYPTYINLQTTPNEALDVLKQLQSSVNAAYNAAIDSVYSGQIALPDQFVQSSESKYLPLINKEEYDKVLTMSLTKTQLNTQQTDLIQQYLNKNQDPTMETHVELLKSLNKMREQGQDPEYLNNLFSLNTAVGLVADELGPVKSRQVLESTLRQTAHNELQKNNLNGAVMCINALSNPSLGEKDYIDFVERYDTNYKYYDSSNPLIASIWYGSPFLKNTDQSIFNDWTNVKNMVSGFISKKQLDGTYPTPQQMQVYDDAKNALMQRLDQQLKINPNNAVYNAMKKSNALIYDTDIIYELFSHPQSPYLASILGQQFDRPENLPTDNDPNAVHQPSTSTDVDNYYNGPYQGGPKISPQLQEAFKRQYVKMRDLDENQEKLGAGRKGGVIHNYLKHLGRALNTASIMNVSMGDLSSQLTMKEMAKRAVQNNMVRWALQVSEDVPQFLKSGNDQSMEFYQQTPQHETMSQETQVFDSVIKPMDKLKIPDFGPMNFAEYDNILGDNEDTHDSNMHHIGGIMTMSEKTLKRFTPKDMAIREMFKVKPNPHKNVKYSEVQGCKTCGTHENLNGYDSDADDVTCDSCLSSGMTSKRMPSHLKKHVKIGSSAHPKHKELHNAIENNKLFDRLQKEPIKNNWDDFKESIQSASKLEKVMSLWKSKYVMDREYVPGDLNKLVFGVGKFLYDEEDTNDEFLDNLNTLLIKYLEHVDKDDSISKKKIPTSFLTFDELKKQVQDNPGILHTIILEIE